MKLPRQLETLAKMLAYILGHRPDEFGLVLDADGFVTLKQLQQALIHEPGWGFVRRHHLDQVVSLLQPPAFEVAEDKIRCLQPGPLPRRRPGEPPPALLYLAIPPKAHERVWQEGLKAPVGQELLLARSKETALKLGKRRAPAPILVTIQAQAAAKAGSEFAGYGEELFLAQSICPRLSATARAPDPGGKAQSSQGCPDPANSWKLLDRFVSARRQAAPAPRQESGTRLEGRDPGLAKAKGNRRNER